MAYRVTERTEEADNRESFQEHLTKLTPNRAAQSTPSPPPPEFEPHRASSLLLSKL